MRDMKVGFTAANPSLVGVDWSFVPAESEETIAEKILGLARAPHFGQCPVVRP
ncbi:hypothetical protein TIFTF001_008879 [Ficus carica]|uniref:Uncharacterized protein n=1 Tax=Ficus carica TaxID=3494 RepID=A0AA88CYG8_FICCA|nr:hypothetical protein TIFTF001_008879 [Ficus carica]